MKPTEKIIKCKSEIASQLDFQQLAAVEAPLNNVCVFAVAGSGKTRVLTCRVANLIDNGIPEKEMILLTFTNKASEEMEERIKKILKKPVLELTAGTFHSVASKLLRKYADKLGFSNNFNILTPGFQLGMLEECRKEYVDNYGEENFPLKNILADIYSESINHNKPFIDYIHEFYPYFDALTIDGILLVFEDYLKRKTSENLFDFDDLLLNFMDLLLLDDVKKEINQTYKYIFVDEYQDINWIQFNILELLNGNNNLFVIGDKNQCIYQFRGSRDEYIDIFEKQHEDVKRYKLNYNYRSTPEILNFAADSIKNNDILNQMSLQTTNSSGVLPFIFGHNTEELEAAKIVEIIKSKNITDFSKVAILVRRGKQIDIIEKAFKKEKISTKLVGGISLFETEHIQDIIAFLQLILNKNNEAAFSRIVKLIPGIGKTYSNEMFLEFKKNNFELSKIYLKYKTKESHLKIFNSILERKYVSVSQMLYFILNDFYNKYMVTRFSDYKERSEDIQYIMQLAKEYTELNLYLDQITINKDNNKNKDKKNTITIITIHKAKGLEWDYVFIPFLSKGSFPKCKEKDYTYNTEQVRNERNLFYVGVTRAKKELYLSYSLYYLDESPAGYSPFLEEINQDLYFSDFYGSEATE